VLRCPKCRLLSPDGSLLCECGYDFRSDSGGGRSTPSAISPILLAALISAIPLEFVAWSGFAQILRSPSPFPSWVMTPWFLFALLVHFPGIHFPMGLLDRNATAQAAVMIVVGYVDCAILAFLVVAVVRAAFSQIKKMRNA